MINKSLKGRLGVSYDDDDGEDTPLIKVVETFCQSNCKLSQLMIACKRGVITGDCSGRTQIHLGNKFRSRHLGKDVLPCIWHIRMNNIDLNLIILKVLDMHNILITKWYNNIML